jgi:diguanylate cyclase (GGDEF)-like protein
MLEFMPQSCPVTAPAALGAISYSKRQQLLQELMGDGELLLKNRLEVHHLMTRDPVTVPPTATVEEMTALMSQRRLHHLLVCSRNGELLGVVSDRDLRPGRGAIAQQMMSFPALSCTPDTPLGAAITYLLQKNISCLPVVDGGRLCGVLTTTDLVLTLQCTLQLWLRLAQVLQHDPTWSKELDKIAASLDGDLTAEQLADRIAAARRAIRQEVNDLVNVVDFRVDTLTGVGSRHELEDVLAMLLAVKKRYERPFSLVVVTIDHFHRIRASCGGDVARPLLKTVVRLIEGAIRPSDFLARCRDDAFAVVLTETPWDAANLFCQRLHDSVRNNADLDVPLRVSVRAAEAQSEESTAELLARAEAP